MMPLPRSARKFSEFLLLTTLLLSPLAPCSTPLSAQEWLTQQSRHFIIIYRQPQESLAPKILWDAENALAVLKHLFNYVPSEKITINAHDFSDYGSAGATTVPHNFVRLEIEPLELGYENQPHTDRIRWLLAHELVHIVVNDLASKPERLTRSIFSKVPPEKEQPLSIFYSLLTNFGRFTPRWHQEGIAVFMETWLNGGFGRVLGSFDEMYFRAMVLDGKSFPNYASLDAKTRDNSFLLDILNYLYGARFATFLAATSSAEKLLSWYMTKPDEFYKSYSGRFKQTFDIELSKAWERFENSEQQFQQANIEKLRSAPLTKVTRLWGHPLGWITRPYLDSSANKVLFGRHQPHYLTSINWLDLGSRKMREIGSLPTPSIIQIASTAYRQQAGHLFFTTNNNRLYRDIWLLNVETGKEKLLFKDCRVGQLTVSEKTGELWGVRHSAARAALVYSEVPYDTLRTLVAFEYEDVLQHLSMSPSGEFLAATLHRASGSQALVVASVDALKRDGKFSYEVVSEDGSPESPSWSPDETYLYWSAFTNGVSNVFRLHNFSRKTEAMSHTLSGLFHPLHLNETSLFAFEFTSDGFYPVIIPNEPATRLPAIEYYGQRIVDASPEVTDWRLPSRSEPDAHSDAEDRKSTYSGFSHIHRDAIYPTISGFRDRTVFGLFAHLADPLFTHDITLEIGISPFRRNSRQPKMHFKGAYEYKREYRLEIEHNAPSFYDLFNERKMGTVGNKFLVGHTNYWKFDVPHQIKQSTELVLYTGIEAINDNLIQVTDPDFLVFESALNSRNLRRAIGSVDSEFGTEWTVTLMGLGANPRDPTVAGGVHAELGRFTTVGWPHNVLHVKLAAGYLAAEKDLAIGRFYLGGFGNQHLENENIKRYRNVFRFPGAPIYSLSTERFAKLLVEHGLPPLRFANLGLGANILTHVETAWFAQGLLMQSGDQNRWLSLGAQLNFAFKHWSNLETTLSLGTAKAWGQKQVSTEWFISLKLFRD